VFLKILQSYTGVNFTELRSLDTTLLSRSEHNSNRVVAQLLNNSDNEIWIRKTRTVMVLKKTKEKAIAKKEEEAAL
jgi:hypothetical protein